jgi:hypothetical protein
VIQNAFKEEFKTLNELKKFKTQVERRQKNINQCFLGGFSKNLEISRKGEWASPDPLFSKVLDCSQNALKNS